MTTPLISRSGHCSLCPRSCNAVRKAVFGGGACGVGVSPKIAKVMLHHWEEPCISGKSGSGCIFFSGCPLRCVYCQNHEISHGSVGEYITAERLSQIFMELERAGASNINLVNPTHFVVSIIEALSLYRPKIPIVYNSSGYESLTLLKALSGLIDVYLPDLKYTKTAAATRYSGAPDYPDTAKAAIKEMFAQRGACKFSEDGLIKSGVIVRHLILPENAEAALDVIDWISEEFPESSVMLSLMSQFTPVAKCERCPELDRPLSLLEHKRVEDYLLFSDLELGYMQDEPYSGKEFIPDFDLLGVAEDSF